jgi:hypothetical protein
LSWYAVDAPARYRLLDAVICVSGIRRLSPPSPFDAKGPTAEALVYAAAMEWFGRDEELDGRGALREGAGEGGVAPSDFLAGSRGGDRLEFGFLVGSGRGDGMLEIIVAIAAIVAIVKIADADGQTPWVWGLVTFGLIALSMVIPLPFIRVLIAAVAAFVLMIVKKVARD